MTIRRAGFCFSRWSFFLTVVFLVHQAALGQGSYTAQVRGTVTDPAHAVVNNAKVTVTNESTSIAATATTNASGLYVVEGAGMRGRRAVVRRGRGVVVGSRVMHGRVVETYAAPRDQSPVPPRRASV